MGRIDRVGGISGGGGGGGAPAAHATTHASGGSDPVTPAAIGAATAAALAALDARVAALEAAGAGSSDLTPTVPFTNPINGPLVDDFAYADADALAASGYATNDSQSSYHVALGPPATVGPDLAFVCASIDGDPVIVKAYRDANLPVYIAPGAAGVWVLARVTLAKPSYHINSALFGVEMDSLPDYNGGFVQLSAGADGALSLSHGAFGSGGGGNATVAGLDAWGDGALREFAFFAGDDPGSGGVLRSLFYTRAAGGAWSLVSDRSGSSSLGADPAVVFVTAWAERPNPTAALANDGVTLPDASVGLLTLPYLRVVPGSLADNPFGLTLPA